MNCLKCGREISEDQAFCEECLENMEQYPVRPGIYVRIPPRKEYENMRQPRRKIELTSEERLIQLQDKVRWLYFIILSLLAVLILMGLFILQNFITTEEEQPEPLARNYIVTQTDGN